MKYLTEDEVRTKAQNITNCDFGQVTTFKNLGLDDNSEEIKNISDYLKKEYNIYTISNLKPDGWYLPKDSNQPALVFELKAGGKNLNDEKHIKQLKKYMVILATRYKKVIGILYNGEHNKIFYYSKGSILEFENNLLDLQDKDYYLNNVYKNKPIDKKLIYDSTAKINKILNFNIKIKSLVERMIFTACFLVAKQNGAVFNLSSEIVDINSLKSIALEHLKFRVSEDNKKHNKQSSKIDELYKRFKKITPSLPVDNKQLKKYTIEFINELYLIAEQLNSPEWNGEDVLSIFFNEFSRYSSSSTNGQVFTPDHITQLMYKISGCTHKHNLLDACCGSGAFLTKAMSLMINEIGGWHTKEAEDIKTNHLFGIDNDEEIYALACANMLLHKDGKTNLEIFNAESSEASKWIKDKKINKVLMNPPYEDNNFCLDIVLNVLNSVELESDCLFLIKENKLIKHCKPNGLTNRILEKHTLYKIIKLPPIFDGVAGAGDVSIFWFKAQIPHNNKPIIGFNIEEDGYKVEPNKGRQDLSGYWTTPREELNNLSPEEYWVNAITNNNDWYFKTQKNLSSINNEFIYLKDFEFSLSTLDLAKTIVDRVMFENPNIAQFFNLKGK